MRILLVGSLIMVSVFAIAQKHVAITFDDLIMGGGEVSFELMQSANTKIISDCNKYNVPAIGFVNEDKLYRNEKSQHRIAILEQWLDNGLELGNHTYSHPSFYKTSQKNFKVDVLKGELVTRRLITERNLELKYFRHPFLNTGSDSLKKANFEFFLDSIGYEVAPVTVESSDYIFNKVYLDAYKANDSLLMGTVGQAYVDYTLRMFDFMESATQLVAGKSIKHIYLCHANHLNAAYMGSIYEGLQEKGYSFINLKEALTDDAYQSKDYYIGPWGISWIYRWDKEKTTEWLKDEPEIDKEILSLYQNK